MGIPTICEGDNSRKRRQDWQGWQEVGLFSGDISKWVATSSVETPFTVL